MSWKVVSKKRKGGKKNHKKSSLHAVNFVRVNGLNKLKSKYHIKVKPHKKHSNLVQLSYSQLQSPMTSPVVQECRNLILDKSNDFEVVCFGFRKFFNLGEKYSSVTCGKFNEKNEKIKVYEKVDGSIICMYYYFGEWYLSSSSLPDASGQVHGKSGNITLKDLFWKIWHKQLKYSLPTDTSRVYIFELFSKDNIILVRHDSDRIVLLGCRNIDQGLFPEVDPELVTKEYGWECVQLHDNVETLDDVVKRSWELNPMEHEGFVVVDSMFNRVKIKSPAYVALSGISPVERKKESPKSRKNKRRRMLRVTVMNEQSEFLVYFPHLKNLFETVKSEYEKFIQFIEGQKKKSGSVNDFVKRLCELFDNDRNKLSKLYASENVRLFFKNEDVKNIESLLENFCVEMNNFDEFEMGGMTDKNNESLEDLFRSVDVSVEEYEKQSLVVEDLRKLFFEKFSFLNESNFELSIFGSKDTRTALNTKSDLDICIKFKSEKPNEKVSINQIQELLSNQSSGKYTKIKPVFTSRFPVIKFLCKAGNGEASINCDISFDHNGVRKSKFLKKYIDQHENVRKMIIMVKLVTKKRGICDPTKRYLNSFALSLMVINFLQIREYLPVFDAVLFQKEEKLSDDEGNNEKLKEFPKELYSLLRDFFEFFGNVVDFEEDCCSVRLGKIVKIRETKLNKNTPKHICVEDPFEVFENTGRTVSRKTRERIVFEFQRVAEMMKNGEDFEKICSSPTVKHRKRKKWKNKKKK